MMLSKVQSIYTDNVPMYLQYVYMGTVHKGLIMEGKVTLRGS